MFLLSSTEIMRISGGEATERLKKTVSITNGSIYEYESMNLTSNGEVYVQEQLAHSAMINGYQYADMFLVPIENGYKYIFM